MICVLYIPCDQGASTRPRTPKHHQNYLFTAFRAMPHVTFKDNVEEEQVTPLQLLSRGEK